MRTDEKFLGAKNMPISTNTKIRLTMLCLSGFAIYSRWVPLTNFIAPHIECISTDLKLLWIALQVLFMYIGGKRRWVPLYDGMQCPKHLEILTDAPTHVNLNGSERQSPSRGWCSL